MGPRPLGKGDARLAASRGTTINAPWIAEGVKHFLEERLLEGLVTFVPLHLELVFLAVVHLSPYTTSKKTGCRAVQLCASIRFAVAGTLAGITIGGAGAKDVTCPRSNKRAGRRVYWIHVGRPKFTRCILDRRCKRVIHNGVFPCTRISCTITHRVLACVRFLLCSERTAGDPRNSIIYIAVRGSKNKALRHTVLYETYNTLVKARLLLQNGNVFGAGCTLARGNELSYIPVKQTYAPST